MLSVVGKHYDVKFLRVNANKALPDSNPQVQACSNSSFVLAKTQNAHAKHGHQIIHSKAVTQIQI